MTTIDDIIAAIPDWQGQTVEAVPISGGITNRALQVRVAGKSYFVSIPGAASGLLAIPRADEVTNARRAAATGVTPRILHYLPQSGVLVMEWLEGRTLAIEDMQAPERITRAAAAARRLHTAEPFVNSFDLFRLARHYREALGRQGLEPPPGYDEYAGSWAEIESAVSVHREPDRPCSNDLCPQNLIEDGEQLWIVDFGYSGNNDPCSELGNAVAEWILGPDQVADLCTAYFGAADPRRLARIQLYAIMSDSAWSLWSVIQEHQADIDFDFRSYGAKRWARARGWLDSSSVAEWAEQARR